MSAIGGSEAELTPTELRDFRRLASFMVPASAEYGMPGADDEIIFSDIVRSLGRDTSAVREALAMLCEIAGIDFMGLDDTAAEAAAMTLLSREGSIVTALGRAVLQCYYRDDRVFRALGIELRPPHPQGRVLEQGDWSLLNAVRGRPRMWRDVEGLGR
jgi:hypothetical protein